MFEAFSAATLIYVTVNIIVVGLMHLVERKLALPGSFQSGGVR